MKRAYPVIISPGEKYLVVYIPDFDINTEGASLADAIEMARDAIGITGIAREDMGQKLPDPTDPALVASGDGEIVTLVDIDFSEYRRKNDMRTVRRNVSLPAWLNARAETAGINVSAVLQNALKSELGIVGK